MGYFSMYSDLRGHSQPLLKFGFSNGNIPGFLQTPLSKVLFGYRGQYVSKLPSR